MSISKSKNQKFISIQEVKIQEEVETSPEKSKKKTIRKRK